MHIVTVGNGTGQATLLRGLREYACEMTAIVGVTDNGGHSGQLRRLLHQRAQTRAAAWATSYVAASCVSALSPPLALA